MFPAGTAGIALLIMRLASGSTLLELLWRHSLSPLASSLLFILPGVALFFGFLTPYASAVTCLIELTSTVGSGAQLEFLIVVSVANTVALGILGPGAYSFDSRIFGRRIIRISNRDKHQHSR
jgi:hypothetical protein